MSAPTIHETENWRRLEYDNAVAYTSENMRKAVAYAPVANTDETMFHFAFFTNNRLVLSGRADDALVKTLVVKYMCGTFEPYAFILLDTNIDQWCESH